MSSIKCWQVDAFTDRPFGGNPAGVCWLKQPMPDDWMQNVAAEMNLAETAFVLRRDDGYGLRWFAPKVEVPLCGHATLASAHTLWTNALHTSEEPVRFHTKSGVLTCRQIGGWIEMDFPESPVRWIDPPVELLTALGVSAARVGQTDFDYFVVVENAEVLRSLSPDFARLNTIPTRGVIVTSPSDDRRYDFVSRFFCPSVGIDEDPVTGSAHCALAPYWGNALGKTELTGFQASARGGLVKVRNEGSRVVLAGQAVTVWQGELLAVP